MPRSDVRFSARPLLLLNQTRTERREEAKPPIDRFMNNDGTEKQRLPRSAVQCSAVQVTEQSHGSSAAPTSKKRDDVLQRGGIIKPSVEGGCTVAVARTRHAESD